MPKPEPHPHLDAQARWTLTAVARGAFCVQLHSFARNPALTVVREALHDSATATPWVVSGYLLSALLRARTHRVVPPDHIADVGEPARLQQRCRDHRPVAAAAVQDHRAGRVQFG